MSALPAVDLRGVRLDEGADGFHRSWIMLFPEGQYEHSTYGKLDFSRKTLAEIKRNFDGGAREIEIAIDRDHKASEDDSRAMGWIERLELREASGETPAGLWAQVRWTPLGLADVKDQVYRYFSPEYKPEYKNQLSGKTFHNVLIGGALTNRPFLKAMSAIQLSHRRAREQEGRRLMEVSRRPWSRVDKDCLPRSAFLIQGDAAHPATWRLPVFEGVGPKDADGRYTRRGPLNINGVRAALAAIGGARQSKPMEGVPARVKARLQRWMKAYGASADGGDGAAKVASERAGRTERGKDGQEGSGMTPMGKTRGSAALKSVRDEDLLDEFALDDGGEGIGLADGEEGDDSEQYDDAGDGEDDGADDGAVDPEEDTHGPITVKAHAHGKYGRHSHSNDADHSDAPIADDEGDDAGGEMMAAGAHSRKASERAHRMIAATAASGARHGREMESAAVRQLREELASVRYQLYEAEVGKTLEGWRTQTFQFKESPKAAAKIGRIALSRVFAEKYRTFMLKRGIRLSEGDRQELNELVETALSTAIVDLSSRGVSYDMEGRRTVKGSDRNRGAADSDRLQERAEQLLAEQGKTLSELSEAQTLALYERAAKEIGYK